MTPPSEALSLSLWLVLLVLTAASDSGGGGGRHNRHAFEFAAFSAVCGGMKTRVGVGYPQSSIY